MRTNLWSSKQQRKAGKKKTKHKGGDEVEEAVDMEGPYLPEHGDAKENISPGYSKPR